MNYAPLNNHETARRRVWADTYQAELQAMNGNHLIGPDLRKNSARHAADDALKAFDSTFPPPEPRPY